MARRRHTPDQIVRKLREADRLLGEAADLAEAARHLEVSEATHHRWRNYGGLKADEAKRLKQLEGENLVAPQRFPVDTLAELEVPGIGPNGL